MSLYAVLCSLLLPLSPSSTLFTLHLASSTPLPPIFQGFRAFELLRSGRDRINYLMVREAKIVAMTCTHAALKRRDMVELAFKVCSVVSDHVMLGSCVM